jgi:carboxymethylenebutenolidase
MTLFDTASSGGTIELTAADGHRLAAYEARPAGAACGGIVVIQEIFGVNRHIRSVVDQYARAGFRTIAPALFDRVHRDADVRYTDAPRGIAIMQQIKVEDALLDVAAAIAAVAASGKVGVVGYCWGGTLAYLAAARLEVAAAVSYYGGGTSRFLAERPRVPVMYHFGERDAHIPLTAVEAVRAANPESPLYLYPADHGFNCADRASFDAPSSALALERSLSFLHEYVG